jgi:hypothetical protein
VVRFEPRLQARFLALLQGPYSPPITALVTRCKLRDKCYVQRSDSK